MHVSGSYLVNGARNGEMRKWSSFVASIVKVVRRRYAHVKHVKHVKTC